MKTLKSFALWGIVGYNGLTVVQNGWQWDIKHMFYTSTAQKWGERMFTGQFVHNLDEKFRLTIPSSFRSELQNGFALTPGPKGSVYIYTKEAWDRIAAKLDALPDTQQNQSFKRYMLSRTKIEYSVEKAGRVMIPEPLRIHGGINKSVAVVGEGSRLVVWPAEKWTSIDAADSASFDDNHEALATLGAI